MASDADKWRKGVAVAFNEIEPLMGYLANSPPEVFAHQGRMVCGRPFHIVEFFIFEDGSLAWQVIGLPGMNPTVTGRLTALFSAHEDHRWTLNKAIPKPVLVKAHQWTTGEKGKMWIPNRER